jgi:uncharacterized protein
MTPQESELIAELFDRLAQLESSPRDPDAERVIAEGLRRAPHAVYPLVQTALVQDEALKRADARIRQLEAAMDGQPAGEDRGGFLGSMRDSLFGRREAPRTGSVPQIRPDVRPDMRPAEPSPWNSAPIPQAPMQPPPPPSYGGGPFGGGSFLGTAAATAAGMVGGGLLLGGIRSMFGGHQGGMFGAYDQPGAGGTPLSSGASGGGSGELAHEAGLDDIGHGGHATGLVDDHDRAGLVDTADNDADDNTDDDTDYDDDAGGSDSDTDYA